jgi:hypothetical protein
VIDTRGDSASERASVILLGHFHSYMAPRRLEHGESNDVWTADEIVLRVAKQPGSSDLLAEADTAGRLDPGGPSVTCAVTPRVRAGRRASSPDPVTDSVGPFCPPGEPRRRV